MKHLAHSALALVVLLAVSPVVAELPPVGPRVVLRMSSYPEYDLQQATPGVLDPQLLPLWMSALDTPERDLHRQVGDALVRAQSLGMKGLDETVAARVRKAFEEADQPVVRRSLARALIALDDRTSAHLLWEHSQKDYQLALFAQPALGRWQHAQAIETSLERIRNPLAPTALLRLSTEVLAEAKDPRAKEPLLDLALTPKVPATVRMSATNAAGTSFSQGLEQTARELLDRKPAEDPLAGLLAADLLAEHRSSEALGLLRELARNENPAVQALALKSLGRIDQHEVAQLAFNAETAEAFSVKHPDANVRRAVIEALYSIADAAAIPKLREFLDDPHPANRTHAGDALFRLAGQNPQFRTLIEQEINRALSETSWRTLERAAIVAGGLDYESTAETLLGLLRHERLEVAVASAWALKELAVPETLPAVLKRLQENLDTPVNQANSEKVIVQTQHLNEQLGLMKHAPADSVLRRWIPMMAADRQISNALARATGMWALGLLHEDQPDPALTAQLMARLKAINAMFNSEPEIIGEAAAYAVGFMRDSSGLKELQSHASRAGTKRSVSHAAAWAVERITSTPLPLPEPTPLPTPSWFLQPLGKASAK